MVLYVGIRWGLGINLRNFPGNIPGYLNSGIASKSCTCVAWKLHSPRNVRINFCIISLIMRSSRTVYVTSIGFGGYLDMRWGCF